MAARHYLGANKASVTDLTMDELAARKSAWAKLGVQSNKLKPRPEPVTPKRVPYAEQLEAAIARARGGS